MNLAMIVSGGGSTMKAILDACKDGSLQQLVVPKLVIATRDCGAIQKAIAAGMREQDVLTLNPRRASSPEQWGEDVIAQCKRREVDYAGLYGCLTRIPENVIEHFDGRMVNQHPSPPQFGGPGMWGKRPHAAILWYHEQKHIPLHDRNTWVISQKVAVEFDEGEVYQGFDVPILDTDVSNDPAPLQKRALPIEHACQIETLEDLWRGNCMFTRFMGFDRDIVTQANEWAIANIEP